MFLDLSRKLRLAVVVITGQAKADKISASPFDHWNSRSSRSSSSIYGCANEAVYVELEGTGQKWQLLLTYSGKITDNMTGICPSYYSIDGVKKFTLNSSSSHLRVKPFKCGRACESNFRSFFEIWPEEIAFQICLKISGKPQK